MNCRGNNDYQLPQRFTYVSGGKIRCHNVLCGTAGIISVNTPQGCQLQVITKNGELDVSLEEVNPKQVEVEELITWLEGGPPHRSGGENGRATMEVLIAIMESSRLHRVIYLPLETEESPLELMIESEQI